MANRSNVGWMNNTCGSPHIEGNLEISNRGDGIFIGGDPKALRSLAKLLIWLANVDQEALTDQPDGERCHVHLYPGDVGFNPLTSSSSDTELCRLDAKGTGDFPDYYEQRKKNAPKARERRKPHHRTK